MFHQKNYTVVNLQIALFRVNFSIYIKGTAKRDELSRQPHVICKLIPVMHSHVWFTVLL